MRLRCWNFFLGLVLAGAGLMLAGCNLSQFSAPSTASSALPGISGTVHGGQQPISGASFQIYAANTSVGKGASTALLSSPVLTNASGGFSIGAGAYTCPTPGTLVYLVATGGNPGLPGNVNNTAIGLMVVLGTCSSLSTDAYVTVNELTTVASVEALAPFMADGAHVGSDVSNPGGLAGAFATAASMVNFATGQIQTAAAGVTQPTALLNTLADILAACVNTTGTTTAGTGCGTLLKYAGTGSATNTAGAMLGIVQAPAANVTQLFGLVGAAVPFAPTLTTTPTDFTSATSFQMTSAGGNEGFLLAIDTAQHIWVYTYANLYDAATDADDLIYGEKITIFDNSGSVVTTIPLTANATAYPLQLAADPFGNMWTINADFSLTKYGPNGAILSPDGGFKIPLSMPLPLGPDGPSPFQHGILSIDPSGNLWVAGNGYDTSCYSKLNNNGLVITPPGNFCSQAGGGILYLGDVDGLDNAWFYSVPSISKVSAGGVYLNSGANTDGCFLLVPAALKPPPPGTFEIANANVTWQMTYDRVNDYLWGAAPEGLGAIRANGSEVFCNTNGSHLPVVPFYSQVPDGLGGEISGVVFIGNIAPDGSGNLWFLTAGFELDVNPPLFNFVSYGGLNEVDSHGNLLTPFDATKKLFGLQGQGYSGLVIDAYGNIWTVGTGLKLIKIAGLAGPKNYQ